MVGGGNISPVLAPSGVICIAHFLFNAAFSTSFLVKDLLGIYSAFVVFSLC